MDGCFKTIPFLLGTPYFQGQGVSFREGSSSFLLCFAKRCVFSRLALGGNYRAAGEGQVVFFVKKEGQQKCRQNGCKKSVVSMDVFFLWAEKSGKQL